MDDAPIESTKERRRNGRPPNAPESYCRSRATIDNTPESRKSLPDRGLSLVRPERERADEWETEKI
jgi:hypothetical protein